MRTDQQLSLSLRPRTFGELIGQQPVISSIERHVASGRLATSWLFDGPPGTGKTSIARIIALSIQCKHSAFGYPCPDCRRANRRGAFNIKDEKAAKLTAGSSHTEALEAFLADSMYVPSEGSQRRVYILDEPQTLSNNGQEYLLETLERDVSTAVFILCTSHPHELTRAIRRRCLVQHMHPLNEEDVEKLVKWVLKKTSSDLDAAKMVDALLEVEVSSPGFIVPACERYLSGMTPREAVKVDTESSYDHKVITRAIKRGDWETVRGELRKAKPEHATAIQMGVAGFLRNVLLDSDPGKDAQEISKAIKLISGYYPDRVMLSVLSAMAYDLCSLFRR